MGPNPALTLTAQLGLPVQRERTRRPPDPPPGGLLHTLHVAVPLPDFCIWTQQCPVLVIHSLSKHG